MGIFAGDRSCEIYGILNGQVIINKENSTVDITTQKRKRNQKELSHTILSTSRYNAAQIFLKYIESRDQTVEKDDQNARFLKQV